MSCSNKRKSPAKRLMALLNIIFIAGLVVGGTSAYAAKAYISAKNEEKLKDATTEQGDDGTIVYGVYDDKVFTQEASLDWEVDDQNFTALNCDMEEEIQEFTYHLCEGYNIDFTLIMAVIKCESNFDSAIISKNNDYGYMQINQINHQWLTDTLDVTDFTDPYQNIRAGVFVFRKLFERYQDTDMVLMAYDMGEDAAARLWEGGIYSTEYTEKVLSYQTQFNEQLKAE